MKRFVKGKRYSSWKIQEENNLVLPFKDIFANGSKAPNGFRSGFLVQLESRQRIICPTPASKQSPANIASKYTSWKKKKHILPGSFRVSIFGSWNFGDHLVICIQYYPSCCRMFAFVS